MQSNVTLVRAPALVSLAFFIAACSHFPLVPDTRTPTDFARDLEPKCATYGEADAKDLLSLANIDSVEPLYAHVKSGTMDPEARLRGVRVHVKPLAGLSREGLVRRVECHQERVVLGRAVAPADDPYVLPGRWLDIGADSEGDGFVVLVQIDEFADAKAVLERARRYVGAK
jgi:hypothetical protein